jgi:hypothetical protein
MGKCEKRRKRPPLFQERASFLIFKARENSVATYFEKINTDFQISGLVREFS